MMKNLQHHKTAMQANSIIIIMFAILFGFVFPKAANAHAAAIAGSDESPVSYGLKINNVEVTSETCNDLSVIKGVSGTVRYEPDTKTLYLEDATIEARYDGINSTIDGLTINVVGENNIKSDDASIYPAINLKFIHTTIKGGGTLNLESNCSCGIYFEKSLEIEDCTVNAKGVWGISGDDATYENLTIRNATVTAEGSEMGSICQIASFTLDGCYIEKPRGAAFDETLHSVALNGETVKDKVVIEPTVPETYLLKIADVFVTSKNCEDLSVIEGVSGTVRFDPETYTLYLENATIAAEKGIYNGGVDGLTINVTGDNNITATKDAAISLTFSPTTITGDGTLNVESNGYCGLYFKKSLEIANCTVTAKGKWGIAGVDGTAETLTIRNATISAEGNKGSICDMLSLTLDGCEISTPYRAVFNETVHAVVLDGQTVTGKVVIIPQHCGVWINGVEVTSENCDDLSVIEGVSGTVKYQPETKTLYMENATITTDAYGIENVTLNGLTINVTGENNLTTMSNAALDLKYNPTIIKGSGTLNIESGLSGIYFEKLLKIEDCTVNVKGNWGIAGANGACETLIIRNATVTAEGGNYGSICDILSFIFDGCFIAQPSGAVFDETVHAVVLDGQIVTGKVVITTENTLKINDVKADNSAHGQGIYSIDGVYLGHDFNALPNGLYIMDGKKVIK